MAAKTAGIYTNQLLMKNQRVDEHSLSIFNEQMKNLCRENGWYYVDVASILKDEEGYLRPEYCNDNPTMGIHLYPKVVPLWVEYLRTHTPKNLREANES